MARKPNESRGYIREIDKNEFQREENFDFSNLRFEPIYFIAEYEFKKELGRYFGIAITTIDLDESDKTYRGQKKPTPSVRSFASFLFQHQNLIANKHATFYRFDQKDKRDQAIDHANIFLGFADQQYFVLNQKKQKLETQIKQLEIASPKKGQMLDATKDKIERLINEYKSLSGFSILDLSPSEMLQNPALTLDKIRKIRISIDSTSNFLQEKLDEYESNRTKEYSELRKSESHLRNLNRALEQEQKFLADIQSISYPHEITLSKTICPLCNNSTDDVEDFANSLNNALEWLSTEVKSSSYTRGHALEEIEITKARIDEIKSDLSLIDYRITRLQQLVELSAERNSISETVLSIKLSIENTLEEFIHNRKDMAQDNIVELKGELRDLQKKISLYDIGNKRIDAEHYLNEYMCSIGKELDFEAAYSPVNLKFSLETFDLWFELENSKKVYLRSMGSGANWLSAHLSLFLGLNRLFCKLGSNCAIPPIAIFDQPSQVYFPSLERDDFDKFTPEKISIDSEGSLNPRNDIESVEKIFRALYKHCITTFAETNTMPQVIVLDHADNLNLGEDVEFETLVRARWRTNGAGLIRLPTV